MPLATSEHLKSFLANLPQQPGVYQMLDDRNEIIYVGKAANLRKRINQYFQKRNQDTKTSALVSHIERIETIVTHTESEALLLENNLIKQYRPRYNILYRDDKSYPYIFVSTNDTFPRLAFHRGAQRQKGRYFGPYPSAGAVRETLQLLQKIFPVRQCEDNFFRNRSRPCLQYQIKRCTAPCVSLIEPDAYAQDVRHAIWFLEGRSSDVIDELVRQMDVASQQLAYERAAQLRDQIVALRRVQEKQYITREGGDVDIIAAASEKGTGCVVLFSIRGGRNLGNKTYFPKTAADSDARALIEAFVPQHYLQTQQQRRDIPSQILIAEKIQELESLQQALSEQAGFTVDISAGVRGTKARWVTMAKHNARQTLKVHLLSHSTLLQRFIALQDALNLDECPEHLECFDISHTMGEATVASCVVFGQGGPIYSDYRRYNITGIQPGDDYAAMEQALLRRYKKIEQGEGKVPDIILIDGGKGQVERARQVVEELQLGPVMLLGVAKGPDRRPGQEVLLLVGSNGDREWQLPTDSMALHLIQQIRDEAHRFAISGHRQRRQKARTHSVLEDIPGLGPKRRQDLLKHFGGLQEIARAGVEDMCRVPGISQALAQRIYDQFHDVL